MATELPYEAEWSDNARSDGLTVQRAESGRWLIRPMATGLAVIDCPCCNKKFLTAYEAKRTASFLFPMAAEK